MYTLTNTYWTFSNARLAQLCGAMEEAAKDPRNAAAALVLAWLGDEGVVEAKATQWFQRAERAPRANAKLATQATREVSAAIGAQARD